MEVITTHTGQTVVGLPASLLVVMETTVTNGRILETLLEVKVGLLVHQIALYHIMRVIILRVGIVI